MKWMKKHDEVANTKKCFQLTSPFSFCNLMFLKLWGNIEDVAIGDELVCGETCLEIMGF